MSLIKTQFEQPKDGHGWQKKAQKSSKTIRVQKEQSYIEARAQ